MESFDSKCKTVTTEKDGKRLNVKLGKSTKKLDSINGK